MSILSIQPSLCPTPAPCSPYRPTAWTSSTKVRAPYLWATSHSSLRGDMSPMRVKYNTSQASISNHSNLLYYYFLFTDYWLSLHSGLSEKHLIWTYTGLELWTKHILIRQQAIRYIYYRPSPFFNLIIRVYTSADIKKSYMLQKLSNYSLIFTSDTEYTVSKVTISKKKKKICFTTPPIHFTITEIQIVYVYYIFFNIYRSWNVQFQRPQSWGCRYPLYAAVPLNGGDHCAWRYVLGLGYSLFLGSGRRDFQHQKTYEHLCKKCILFMYMTHKMRICLYDNHWISFISFCCYLIHLLSC